MKKLLATILVVLSVLGIGCLGGCNIEKLIDTHTHEYVKTVVDPTCIEGGYTLHECECGDKYQDTEVEMLGHHYEAGVCTVCGAVDPDYVPVEEHTHEYVETVFAPTCTAKGYTLYVCVCGYEYSDNETEALGHTPLEAVEENKVAPTCTEDGGYDNVIYCSVCDAEISRESVILEAPGHEYTDKVVVESTCLEAGYVIKVCDVCKDCIYLEMPEVKHDYVIDESTLTELEEGKITFTAICSLCADAKVFEAQKVETVFPTCISEGYDAYEVIYDEEENDEVVSQFHLNKVDPTHKHIVGELEDGSVLELYGYGTESYDIDEVIEHFIDNGSIMFSAGNAPTEPGESGLAIFECAHCHSWIVIELSVSEVEQQG